MKQLIHINHILAPYILTLGISACTEPTTLAPNDGDLRPSSPAAPQRAELAGEANPHAQPLFITGDLPGVFASDEIFDTQKSVRIRAWGQPADEAPPAGEITDLTLSAEATWSSFFSICDNCINPSKEVGVVAGWADTNLDGECNVGDFWFAHTYYYGSFGQEPVLLWVHNDDTFDQPLHFRPATWGPMTADDAEASCDFLEGGTLSVWGV